MKFKFTLDCLMPIDMRITIVNASIKVTPLSTATAISKSSHREQLIVDVNVHGCLTSSVPILDDSMTVTAVEPTAPIAAKTAINTMNPNLHNKMASDTFSRNEMM